MMESAPAGIRVVAVGRTDVGRRRADNQDRMLVQVVGGEEIGCEAEDRYSFGPEAVASDGAIIALVADGMGGRAGGERAAALTVDAVRRHFGDGAANHDGVGLVAGLITALREANTAVLTEAKSDEAVSGMGSTATLAAIHDAQVFVVQVGDSRAYLIRGDRLTRLTRDQSLVQSLIDSGILDESDAETIPDNVLLQAIGVQERLRPTTTVHTLREGDRLLLCSDGLSQMVPDEEIARHSTALEDPARFVEQLVDLANERGGPDNTTIVMLELRDSGLPEATPEDGLGARKWKRPSAS